ncbi:flagellar hook-associated protein 3 [Alicyclobacillus cellulosilyticus]|uniref:Flagellin n=1 Tax=Alicyclobacillus cellulosilyticus TaxID=1003997 RepID=A0A917NNN5_9BACL|nr:flagellin [Alicyclobacillus cellulosilyticus]GGJ11403.1 flagellar hook-associated protein 3 [Alicyclobacillus cellulosilyticus]
MRVTTFGANQQYLSDLNSIMQTYQQLEQELSTGRKLNQPSDDPVAFDADILAQTQLAELSHWQSNASKALEQMRSTDATMQSLQDTLGKIRTQLVEVLNGTLRQKDIAGVTSVVKQLVAAVAQNANTSDGEQYVFGGIQGKTQLISVLGTGALQWVGGASTINQQLKIGQTETIGLGVDGNQLFNTAPAGTSNSLIATLNNIINHLNSAATAGSAAAMQAALQNVGNDLNDLDANIDNVTAMRADLGGRMQRVQAVQTQLQQISNALTAQKGNAEDADLAKVISQLATQQTVYQAALVAGQRLILPTLADVMKA